MAGSVIHCNAIRIRVVGNGNLDCQLQGFSAVLTQDLIDVTMIYPDPRIKMRLANFISQAIKLRVGSDTLENVGRVNDITLFVKPLWSEYPG